MRMNLEGAGFGTRKTEANLDSWVEGGLRDWWSEEEELTRRLGVGGREEGGLVAPDQGRAIRRTGKRESAVKQRGRQRGEAVWRCFIWHCYLG